MTSWAEPGEHQRHEDQRQRPAEADPGELGARRAARSSGVVPAPCGTRRTRGLGEGDGRHAGAFRGREASTGQYHQSQRPLPSRRAGAALVDLPLLREPVVAPDLASRSRRRSVSFSGSSGGISRGRPSSSIATKTRYAEATCNGSLPASFHGSASTRTPISIDVRPAQLTWPMVRTMSPTCTGCRNAISSIAAVTAGPPLCRWATAPAVLSDQTHDHPAVHVAEQVHVALVHEHGQAGAARLAGSRERYGRRDASVSVAGMACTVAPCDRAWTAGPARYGHRHGAAGDRSGPGQDREDGYDWLYARPDGRQPARRRRRGDARPLDATGAATGPAGPDRPRRTADPDRARPLASRPPKPPGRPTGQVGRTAQRQAPLPLALAVVALVAWLVYLVAVPVWAWFTVSKVDAEPDGAGARRQPGTTYLVVGSDARAAAWRDVARTRSCCCTSATGPNLLMSIPRDSIVTVPGHGTDKINAAFAFGGPKLLVKTVEDDTDIRVDHYVEIGFTGFVKLVDAVGGITICPTTAMKDPLAELDIPKGCQEADGETALGYARSRKTQQLGDIGRAQHQREVVSAIGERGACRGRRS